MCHCETSGLCWSKQSGFVFSNPENQAGLVPALFIFPMPFIKNQHPSVLSVEKISYPPLYMLSDKLAFDNAIDVQYTEYTRNDQ